ncbi:hypothetical protein LCGC14_0729280 [marine sediment metagenome]|uniref:Transcription regulator TrmB N-terminal domain-containing protein n=1 Tax=marine sediment metagenome TaxID=412755 RepID=A0A0F9SVD2_9ZZZZ|nr:MAG: hypothetical protein Lokiarch_50580 [Candidatus Lokiarchaeum sp. GC14_75]
MANNTINQKPISKGLYSHIQYNLLKILEEIGPSSRKELVKQLDTPRTTIYDNLVSLQKRKLIEKYSRNEGKRGRPHVLWKLKID